MSQKSCDYQGRSFGIRLVVGGNFCAFAFSHSLPDSIEGRRELGKFVIEGEENVKAAIEAGVSISVVAVRDDIWDRGNLSIALKTPGMLH